MAATTGGCLCREVRYEFTGDIALKAFCYCNACSKWGGSAGLPNAVVSTKDFRLTEGVPKTYDTVGDSGKVNRHFFCGNCGSSLYCELELLADKTAIKAGSLDKPDIGPEIAAEFFVGQRPSYLKPIEGAQQAPAFL